jgi:hypothetical protein
MWTQFWDMNSGGGQKEPYKIIYIEAPEDEAKVIFYNRFGHNPERVTCTCCGEDYSIDEEETLEKLTGFHRGCAYVYRNAAGEEVSESEAWKIGKGLQSGYSQGYEERQAERSSFNKYFPLAEYLEQESILVIRADEIKPEERAGEVPAQGYVWVD